MSSDKIGIAMKTYGVVLPKGNCLSSFGRRINISKEAKKRLGWFDHSQKNRQCQINFQVFCDISANTLPLEEKMQFYLILLKIEILH